jgi:hypothetical protein
MNGVYDEIRALLSAVYPDKAELMRIDITVVLTMLKLEILKWSSGKSRGNVYPLYPRGAILDCFGMDSAEIAEIAAEGLIDPELLK